MEDMHTLPDAIDEQQSAPEGEQTERAFTQADVDRIVRREQARWKRQQESAVAEAQRLAREEAASSLAAREADITRRELRAMALSELAARQMPGELAQLLSYTDEEACRASLTTVADTWQRAVQQAVEQRMAGSAPQTGGAGIRGAQTLQGAIRAHYTP